jgi:hypothetical protein
MARSKQTADIAGSRPTSHLTRNQLQTLITNTTNAYSARLRPLQKCMQRQAKKALNIYLFYAPSDIDIIFNVGRKVKCKGWCLLPTFAVE